ncbi:phosphonate metabolism protein/1,5-bisphosphokinase (PRPP-forming) PhnN [Desulfovibrio litoralis]|uniref:ribose 1,5-bisphosphate phosphokinase n=1 Tax=Desulfovibrio litoralis DSM 11393 TaxID=1121455 RepID=A0A1M7SSG8_9BACT|nr:phosphonate metabolism protein/1,5-bisphosphokinase (PRPP-forming) PhnN [Desulfovibrio litoralis]SHN61503.1 ribose 1,5-bisphosphokinase [Desulfovibrio litoralis DSM 11393]
MKGCLVYVVGASGVGKDSLLNYAKEYFEKSKDKQNFKFVRRYITRPADVKNENNRFVSADEFEQLEQDNFFSMSWKSHGLSYGISKEIDGWLQNGDTVILNGSRNYLNTAIAKYPNLTLILITASPEVLKDRLMSRGREDLEGIRERMQTQRLNLSNVKRLITIDNSGELKDAQQLFIQALE